MWRGRVSQNNLSTAFDQPFQPLWSVRVKHCRKCLLGLAQRRSCATACGAGCANSLRGKPAGPVRGMEATMRRYSPACLSACAQSSSLTSSSLGLLVQLEARTLLTTHRYRWPSRIRALFKSARASHGGNLSKQPQTFWIRMMHRSLTYAMERISQYLLPRHSCRLWCRLTLEPSSLSPNRAVEQLHRELFHPPSGPLETVRGFLINRATEPHGHDRAVLIE